MRSRSSSKQSNRSMEVERFKTKEEPHLSGAYIRSLVKQLSSSRPKEAMNPKSPHGVLGDHELTKLGQDSVETQQEESPQPQQPKKQVRRRLHTSRPYQERLLNMAEARREIVTALKFHRASMKQANEQQQQQQQIPPPPPTQLSPPTMDESHQELMMNSRIYPTNTILPNYIKNPPFSPFTYPPPLSWAYPSIAPLSITDNLNLPLPNQPLGLNLNFHDFNNIDTSFYNNTKPHSSPSSPSSTSYSYSSPPTTMSAPEVPSISDGPPRGSKVSSESGVSNLHQMLDDEEMAEIRSISEQYEVEWNDTMNLVTSAWWCKFLKTMEVGPHEGVGGGEGDGFQVFDEVMEIPAWLSDGSGENANESCLLQQHFDDYNTEDYLQDSALPCLDIGEIEGLDGEWLS